MKSSLVVPCQVPILKIMYAIAFDLDTEKLKASYGKSHNNAYGEIRDFLAARGFKNQQGSLYYGDETVTQVSAVLAIVELSRQYAYIKPSVADIRILRLLDADDLMPAVIAGHP